MNFHNDNFNSNNNSLSLSFTGKGLNDTSNSLNNYLKTGIGFQLLSNNSNYKEFVIADTSNINSNYFASLRIAVEKSQISLKSITSNNIIQPLIINSNIFITSNIGIGKTNPLYNIDAISNINADNYFIKNTNISNIFVNSNSIQTSIQTLSNLTNSWTKITSSIIYTNSNVGINKINPSYNLDVAGNINFTGELTKNGIIYKNFSGNFNDLTDKPDNTWKLIGNNIYNINSGNVGINSSTPTRKLEVVGDINVKGTFNYMKNGSIYGGNWYYMEQKPDFASVAYSGLYADLKDKPSSSDLSGLTINWSDIRDPPNLVQVATTGNYRHLTNLPEEFSKNYIDLTNKPDIFFVKTPTNTNNIYNNNTGNVGIKNNSPAYALDVVGDIKLTGLLRLPNNNAFNGTYDSLQGKPILKDIATSASFDDILYNKPDFYPTDWGLINGKPTTFFDGDFLKLSNTPPFFKTNWSNIQGNIPLATIAYTGSYGDLVSNITLPKLHPIATSGKWSDIDINGKPTISAVGLTGNYYDLSNLPVLFSSNWADIENKPNIFDWDYNSLSNKPYVAFSYNSVNQNISSSNNGNVGIGVITPLYKLHVNGDININGPDFNYYRNGIKLTSAIATFSDSRIKINIADIEDTSALDKIMKIEPKNYNYIDTDERGTNNVIGFIAQQIKDVIPEAITIGEEYIPNIYKYYTIISSNMILVDDANINKIFIGNTLKIKVNNISRIAKVINKVNKTITIDIQIDVNAKCLIYGIKINDFHFIDKTYIYTLNVCATQEIYRRLEEQKKEIAELRSLISKIVS